MRNILSGYAVNQDERNAMLAGLLPRDVEGVVGLIGVDRAAALA